nr:hypothetical protein [Angustibacter aerolatus]
MSSAKTERLLNLVICLLSTRRPLTKAQIRQSVPQYAEHVSTEAFERMFERDKDEPARPRGTAADHRRGPAVRRRHRLPRRPRGLRPARGEPRAGRAWPCSAWRHGSGSRPRWPVRPRARSPRLTALGAPPDDGSLIGLEPRIRTSEPAFDPLWAAVRDRTPVAFGYRTGGRGERTERHLEPWAVTTGTAAGTSPATTATATRPACSASRASSRRCGSSGRPGVRGARRPRPARDGRGHRARPSAHRHHAAGARGHPARGAPPGLGRARGRRRLAAAVARDRRPRHARRGASWRTGRTSSCSSRPSLRDGVVRRLQAVLTAAGAPEHGGTVRA